MAVRGVTPNPTASIPSTPTVEIPQVPEVAASQPQGEAAVAPPRPSQVELPKTPSVSRDQAKANQATAFVGRGTPDSPTDKYRQAFGERANPSSFTADDVVMTSSNGNRQDAVPPAIDNLRPAMLAGSTILTDDINNRSRKDNTGERQVAAALSESGYVEPLPGVWKPSGPKPTVVAAAPKQADAAAAEEVARIDEDTQGIPEAEPPATTLAPMKNNIAGPPTKQLKANRVDRAVGAVARFTEKMKKDVRAAFKPKNADGMILMGQIQGDFMVPMNAVSLGAQDILAKARVNQDINSWLESIGVPNAAQMDLGLDSQAAVVEAINASGEQRTTVKHPGVYRESTIRRDIVAHFGRGIKLNPLMSKGANADFDGDTFSVYMDPNAFPDVASPASALFSVKDELTIDRDFVKIRKWGNTVDDITDRVYDALTLFGRVDPDSMDRNKLRSIANGIKLEQDGGQGLESIVRSLAKLNDDTVQMDILNSLLLYNWQFAEVTGVESVTVAQYKMDFNNNYGEMVSGAYENQADQPVSWHEWLESVSAYAGEVQGNNLFLRQAAAATKPVRAQQAIMVNENEWQSETERLGDSTELLAAKLNLVSDISKTVFSSARWLRKKVILSTRFLPQSGLTVEQWIEEFHKNYNANLHIVDAAYIDVFYNWETTRKRSGFKDYKKALDLDNMRSAFINVFGPYKLETVFGGDMIPAKFQKYAKSTVEEFAAVARGSFVSSGQTVSTKHPVESILNSIASGKISAAREFNTSFNEVFDRSKVQGETVFGLSEVVDPDVIAEALFDVTNGVSAKSGWGLAETIDMSTIRKVGAKNIAFTLVARGKLSKWKNAYSDGSYAKAAEELRAVASSSPTWEAIATSQLYYRAGMPQSVVDAINNGSLKSVVQLVTTLAISYEDKIRALNVIQKDVNRNGVLLNKTQTEDQVLYDIYADPGLSYASSIYSYASAIPDAKKGFSRAKEALNKAPTQYDKESQSLAPATRASAQQSLTAISKAQVGDMAALKEQYGSLEEWLKQKNTFHVVPSAQLAEAILAQSLITGASGEKNSQEIAANLIYHANSVKKFGGQISDLEASDGYVSNMNSILSAGSNRIKFKNALLDPDAIEYVVMQDGTITVVTQAAIFSAASVIAETDVTTVDGVLAAMPKLFSFLYKDSVSATDEDNNPTKAQASFKSNDVSSLSDHPSFACLATLLVPRHGRKPAAMKKEMTDAVETVYSFISGLSVLNAEEINAKVDALADQVIAAYPDNPDVAAQIANDIKINIMGLVRDVDPSTHVGNVTHLLVVQNDWQTMSSYFNTKESLAGSKTAISTSANGGISRGMFGYSMLDAYTPTQPCDAEPDVTLDLSDPDSLETFLNEWESYEGCVTTAGFVISEETVANLIQTMTEQGNIGVYRPSSCTHADGFCCEHHSPSVEYLHKTESKLTPSAIRFILLRGDGTEGNNLKIKKIGGTDGKDSITKIMDTGTKLISTTFNIATPEDMRSVRQSIAKTLKARDAELGYSSQPMSHYEAIAVERLRPVEGIEGATHIFLTTGAMTAIAENAINSHLLNGGEIDYDTIQQTAILSVTKQPVIANESTLDYLNSLKHGVNGQANNAGLLEHSSVPSRIVDTIEKLIARLPEGYGAKALGIPKAPNKIGTIPLGDREVIGAIKGGKITMQLGVSPNYAYLIMDDSLPQKRTEMLAAGSKYGISVYLPTELVPEKFALDAIELDNNFSVIPFFDMHMNGNSVNDTPKFIGVRYIQKSSLTYGIEDPVSNNEFALGDSDMMGLKNMHDNARIKRDGELRIPAGNAFASTVADGGGGGVEVSFAPRQIIINSLISMADNRYAIDPSLYQKGQSVRVSMGNNVDIPSDFAMDNAIARYVERFQNGEADNNGMLVGKEVATGDVVGFLMGTVGEETSLFPLVAYAPDYSVSSPEAMTVNSVYVDQFTNEICMPWQQDELLSGASWKFFEYTYAGNKFIVRMNMPEQNAERFFRNGVPVSFVISENSVSGRKGQNKKITDMETAFFMCRQSGGFNLADVEGAFPTSPEFAERISNGDVISMDEWQEFLDSKQQILPASAQRSDHLSFSKWMQQAIDVGVNPSILVSTAMDTADLMPMFRLSGTMPNSETFPEMFGRYLNILNPKFYPGEVETGDTLFTRDYKMLYTTYSGGVEKNIYVNVFGGLNFGDDHSDRFRSTSIYSTNGFGYIDNVQLHLGKHLNKKEMYRQLGYGMENMPLGLTAMIMAHGNMKTWGL